MIRVKSVEEGSLGAELGLGPGAELISVNGRAIADFLDWEFLTADDHLVLLVRDQDGGTIEYDVERPEGLALGVEVEPPRVRRCANRCDFCFVDGNPKGMRSALYVRDDDYRLSFRYGNFATLTNLKPADVERIIEYRLTPLYVSVHATDPVVRRRLLRNPLAPDVVEQLREFGEAGIESHTQIVLQPGLNDGEVLARSLDELFGLGPMVRSVSVVPVGLTTFSRHHLVREPTPEECARAVALVEQSAERARPERGLYWAYGSDELYLRARLPLPPAERYDSFEQLENGVGSVRYLQGRVAELSVDLGGARIAVLTGSAMGPLMPQILDSVEAGTGADCQLIVLENDLFGRSVTTAGLLPGRAFAAALAGCRDADMVLLPAEAVNDSGVFIDDVHCESLATDLPCPVHLSHDFADVLASAEDLVR